MALGRDGVPTGDSGGQLAGRIARVRSGRSSRLLFILRTIRSHFSVSDKEKTWPDLCFSDSRLERGQEGKHIYKHFAQWKVIPIRVHSRVPRGGWWFGICWWKSQEQRTDRRGIWQVKSSGLGDALGVGGEEVTGIAGRLPGFVLCC